MLGLCRLTPCIGVNGGIVSSEGGKFLWLVHQPFRGADLAGTLSIVQLLWLFLGSSEERLWIVLGVII